jgi:hypothetical protein
MIKNLEEIQTLSEVLRWTHVTRRGLLYIPKGFGPRAMWVTRCYRDRYEIRLIPAEEQEPPLIGRTRYIYCSAVRAMFRLGELSKNTKPLGFLQDDNGDLVTVIEEEE